MTRKSGSILRKRWTINIVFRETHAGNALVIRPNEKMILGGAVGRFSHPTRGTRDFALVSVLQNSKLIVRLELTGPFDQIYRM